MNGEVDLLKEKVSRLEHRLDELIRDRHKESRCQIDVIQLVWKYCTMNEADIQKATAINDAFFDKISAEFRGAFERIKNLELTVYPGLTQDLLQLHRIIGDEKGKGNLSDDR
jgi:hypothetical protein